MKPFASQRMNWMFSVLFWSTTIAFPTAILGQRLTKSICSSLVIKCVMKHSVWFMATLNKQLFFINIFGLWTHEHPTILLVVQLMWAAVWITVKILDNTVLLLTIISISLWQNLNKTLWARCPNDIHVFLARGIFVGLCWTIFPKLMGKNQVQPRVAGKKFCIILPAMWFCCIM